MNTIAPHTLALLTLGLLTSGCASHGVPTYVAPSNDTIESGTDMSYGAEGQYIYVANRSSVPIIVTGLRLTDCQNVKNRCEVVRLRVEVGPGQRRNIMTVKTDNPNLSSSFRFTYTWEPAHTK